MSQTGRMRVRQALVVSEHDETRGCEVRITTDDEAKSFLWAAQWLDEHREYFVESVDLVADGDLDDERDVTRTLVLRAALANERSPRELGPWTQGVPPMFHC